MLIHHNCWNVKFNNLYHFFNTLSQEIEIQNETHLSVCHLCSLVLEFIYVQLKNCLLFFHFQSFFKTHEWSRSWCINMFVDVLFFATKRMRRWRNHRLQNCEFNKIEKKIQKISSNRNNSWLKFYIIENSFWQWKRIQKRSKQACDKNRLKFAILSTCWFSEVLRVLERHQRL